MWNWIRSTLLRKYSNESIHNQKIHLQRDNGFILWDVLSALSILMIVIPLISKMVYGIEHEYDRIERQLEATEQVQLFLIQLQEDVAKSVAIQPAGSSVHLVQYDGRTVDLNENPSPTARHIIRLINGKGGEVACLNVLHVTFQLAGKTILHLSIDVAVTNPNQGTSYHFDASFRSYLM